MNGVLNSSNWGDKYFDMQLQFNANVSRFAAFKAYHATQQLREQLKQKDGVTRAKSVLNTFNRYQAAEYNTCVNRCRTAKQWIDFTSDPERNKLFPNLKWIPSRSADPREEHIVFYGLVLPKTDPFWLENQPGQLWNCKCDWEETDEPAAPSAPESVRPARGLEGNPAVTGEIFTESAAYFKGIDEQLAFRIRGAYFPIAKKFIYNKLRKLKNTKTLFQTLNIQYNNFGNGHIIHDLYWKNSVFLKNETLLYVEDFLINNDGIITMHNSDKGDPVKKDILFLHYIKIKTQLDLYYVVREFKDGRQILYAVVDVIPK